MKKFIFIFLALIAAESYAQNNLDQAKQETSTFLKSLAPTITEGNYKMYGLSSPEDASQMEAGMVFVSSMVPLDKLKTYVGGDVKPLIMNINRASCTVINRQTQQTIGLVDLELQKGMYVVKGFSGAGISAALGRINSELFKQNFSLVKVPSLNMVFGSIMVDNQLKFVSLQNNSELHTEIGEIAPAKDFLQRLVPMANAYNGLPW
jgi:hypothetical protein